jgi:hypothetical protein
VIDIVDLRPTDQIIDGCGNLSFPSTTGYAMKSVEELMAVPGHGFATESLLHIGDQQLLDGRIGVAQANGSQNRSDSPL